MCSSLSFSFYYQAEDGIRDRDVTGVQTCALPIWRMGITKMADANREMKRQQKIGMQTDAILRADDVKEMREMMGGCCD